MPRPLPADTWTNLFYPPSDYQYFIDAATMDFEPGAAAFSEANACWLADAALLAYVHDWDVVSKALLGAKFEDLQPIGAAENLSTKGFIATRLTPSPFLIVSFRGTDRDDERSINSDKDIGPAERDGYTVHRGFAKALDQVWTTEVEIAITNFLANHPQGSVYFTGHSLGAALATVAVTRFSGLNCALYTFGSPRVGDDRFSRSVSSKTNRLFRFVNSQDIVTQIPPSMPFEHYFQHIASMEKYIDGNGKIHDSISDNDRALDVMQGMAHHDSLAALTAMGHPADYLASALRNKALGDPPPYIVGNHTPARYAITLWNRYAAPK